MLNFISYGMMHRAPRAGHLTRVQYGGRENQSFRSFGQYHKASKQNIKSMTVEHLAKLKIS